MSAPRRTRVLLLSIAAVATALTAHSGQGVPRAQAVTGVSGTITITDKTDYSNTSGVATNTADTTCTAHLTFHSDGSASGSVTYTHNSVYEENNNGSETKTTVQTRGSGTISYSGDLRVDYANDGSYTFSFGEPAISAQQTTTTESTGRQPQTNTITVDGIVCSYDANDLRGWIGGGTSLHRVAISHGHYGATGEEYGSSTVEWTINDPTLGSSPGKPAPPPLSDTYASGTITINDSGSYSNNSTGDTYDSQTTCNEQITVSPDGSASATINYSYTSTHDQNNNGFETKTTETVQGSGQVSSYDGDLRVDYANDGSYSFSFNAPNIVVQETTTTESTGQQPRTNTVLVTGISCIYNANATRGKLGSGTTLRGSVSTNTSMGQDGRDQGPSGITWQIEDPKLAPQTSGGGTPIPGSVDQTPAAGPTGTSGSGGQTPVAGRTSAPTFPAGGPTVTPTSSTSGSRPHPHPKPKPKPKPQPTPRTGNPPGCEPSGARWVARFPADNRLSALSEPFRDDVLRFIAALQRAGATVHIETVYRPDQRAYLMHYAWLVAHGTDARTIPRYKDNSVNICWAHYTVSGTYDARASRDAARAMVAGYGIVFRPAYPGSNHSSRRAIDMSISWSGTLTIVDGTGLLVRITTLPRTGAGNAQLWRVGASYGVIKLVGDAPHWSANGH